MSKTVRKVLLDNVTGTSSSTPAEVEGDFLLIASGGTIGTLQLKAAQNTDETHVNLDGGEITTAIAKVITLPPCSLQVDYTGSTGVTVVILPYRRD